jgi:hypothetical protein
MQETLYVFARLLGILENESEALFLLNFGGCFCGLL